MMGRYGHDSLNQAMAVAALVLMILGMFGLRLFSWLAMALLVAVYFRMFSRNIPARSQENAKYYYLRTQVQKRMNQYKTRWAQRKFYRYYRCPHCHQQLRVLALAQRRQQAIFTGAGGAHQPNQFSWH